MPLALCIHILLSFAANANALPTGISVFDERFASSNASTTTTPAADSAWVASPKQRGTFQLLIGCLTTLSLCAWTAYHPNVRPNKGAARALWRRFAWMVAAVVGPEVVLYYAWEQRWMAGLLRGKVKRLGGRAVQGFDRALAFEEDECTLFRCPSAPTFASQSSTLHEDSRSILSLQFESSASKRPESEQQPGSASSKSYSPFMRFSFEESEKNRWQHKGSAQSKPQHRTSEPTFTPWTLQQSLFAVCGGITVDTSSFWDVAQVTLTPRGLLVLARAGLLPQVTDEEVTEKSKANIAAKILVCIQAGWFLVQAVARLAQKLPLTLLEVHVLAHVLCALAMYFCWVEKPYDVEMPVVVKDEQVKDLVSLFVLDASGSKPSNADILKAVLDRLVRPIPMSEIWNRHRPRKWVRDPSITAPRFRFKMDLPSDIDDRTDGDSDDVSDDERVVEVEREPPTPQELARMQEHHKRVNRGLDYLRNRYFQAVACRGDGEMPPEPQLYFERTSSSAKWKYVVNERSNRKIEGAFAKKDKEFGRFDKAFSVISAIYGTFHLSAWNEHFPSTAECWMWRVGALCMVVAPSVYQAHSFVERFLDRATVPPKDEWVRAKWLFWIAKVARLTLFMFVELPLIVIGFIAAAGCGYGRMFMLLESFLSLRSPPVDTYQIPEWSTYFPHAG